MATIYSASALRQPDSVESRKPRFFAAIGALHWIAVLALTSWLLIGGMAILAYTATT